MKKWYNIKANSVKAVRTFNKYSWGTGEFIRLFIYLEIGVWRTRGMERGECMQITYLSIMLN